MKNYEWIVIGGGIAGITIAEILSRENKSVLLIEKNKYLASETSKEFHEWFHSGTLHTLVPDKLLTLRYLLGATDDLLEYYQSFQSMNLVPSASGLAVKEPGWFYENSIQYKYKIHKYNPVWMAMVSNSINITRQVSNHDWLRRRAGAEYGHSNLKISHWLNLIPEQLKSRESFKAIKSPDITMNSRKLISDILSHAIANGVEIKTDSEVISIDESCNKTTIKTTNANESYVCNKVVVCAPDLIAKKYDIPIKKSYAPMAIVENLSEDQNSFVELDYFVNRCINMLVKPDRIGQAGGISLANETKVKDYLEYLIKEHKKRSPQIKVIDTYVGIKKELVQRGENRNYLYHINNPSKNVWTIILGKFSLAFSMAPEFFRRVYNRNPRKIFNVNYENNNSLISKTSWQEIAKK